MTLIHADIHPPQADYPLLCERALSREALCQQEGNSWFLIFLCALWFCFPPRPLRLGGGSEIV